MSILLVGHPVTLHQHKMGWVGSNVPSGTRAASITVLQYPLSTPEGYSIPSTVYVYVCAATSGLSDSREKPSHRASADFLSQ